MATVLEPLQLLPETVADIDALVAAGHAPSRAAVVAGLVARQVARQRALDAAIAEGIASGFVTVTTEQLLADLRTRHAP
jgi:predicted transcriptional regulator